MAYTSILYGPESEPYSTYAVKTPAPPDGFSGGPIMYRHVQPLGKQLVLEDGRKFRFAAVGGSTLVIGNLLTAGVLTASQQNLTAAAGSVGDRSATMTTGAASARNLFAEGYLHAAVTPGIHQVYRIAGHAVMTSGAGDIVYFAPGHALREAVTTSTRWNLVDNPYFRVIQCPATTVASIPVGVAIVANTTLRGGWVQTRGVCGVLVSGTAIAGDSVSSGLGDAGAMGPIADNTQDTSPAGLGWCIFATGPYFLTIDG